jgi:hypothetical protein
VAIDTKIITSLLVTPRREFDIFLYAKKCIQHAFMSVKVPAAFLSAASQKDV